MFPDRVSQMDLVRNGTLKCKLRNFAVLAIGVKAVDFVALFVFLLYISDAANASISPQPARLQDAFRIGKGPQKPFGAIAVTTSMIHRRY